VYLFHAERVQALPPPVHYERRKALLLMATARDATSTDFLGRVSLMDGARFTPNIILNTRNQHALSFRETLFRL
jgi:hypothetical protein